MAGGGHIVARETAISILVNAAISAGMFFALFGLAAPAIVPGRGGYAFDFLPQAFMVALMGSLVPGLIGAARAKSHPRLQFWLCRGWPAILLRSLAVALLALVVAGGGAMALLLIAGIAAIAPPLALGVKVAFGGLLALLVTPGAVRFALCEAGSAANLHEAPYGNTH